MTTKPEPRREVEVVRSTYQPSKAELEEDLRLPNGLTPEQAGRALTRTVKASTIHRPKRQR